MVSIYIFLIAGGRNIWGLQGARGKIWFPFAPSSLMTRYLIHPLQ